METVALLSLTSAFLILFITKIGLREQAQMKGSATVSKLFGCDFCLSFWINLFMSFILYIFVRDATVLMYCFVATPITRFLI